MRKRSEAVSRIGQALPHAEDSSRRGAPAWRVTRGRLDSLRPDGQVVVRVDGRLETASLAASVTEAEMIASIRARVEVALGTLDGGGLVILGILRDRLSPVAPSATPSEERVVEIAATHALELRAGDAVIRLTGDGRVEIRGLEVISIAEGEQRIIGATVSIN